MSLKFTNCSKKFKLEYWRKEGQVSASLTCVVYLAARDNKDQLGWVWQIQLGKYIFNLNK